MIAAAHSSRMRPEVSPPRAPFLPSRYQQAFFDELVCGDGDIQLVAVAGSGKTRSIQEAVKRLPRGTHKRTLLTAFNKHIETELKARQRRGEIPAEVTVSTIHGLGRRTLWREFRADSKRKDSDDWIDDRKYERLAGVYFDKLHPQEEPSFRRALADATAQVARLAMLTLTDPEDMDRLRGMAGWYGLDLPPNRVAWVFEAVPEVLKWGREGLPKRDRDGLTWHPRERISFDDMVYLPNALNLFVRPYEILFVDECQDLNRAQQQLLLKAKGRRGGGGRAVWVGDPRQGIYGFAGADMDAWERIGKVTGAKALPLSVCYRCGRKIVELARRFVPEIEEAPGAVEGEVLTVSEEALLGVVRAHHADPATRHEPFLLLCRVNAPLVGTALDLIASGVPAKVKGRDIGQGLMKLLREIEALPGYRFSQFPDFAESYRRTLAAALMGKPDTEMLVAGLNDRVESLRAVYRAVAASGWATVEEMERFIDRLFSDDAQAQAITLSSIHKAKGLEAERVGILQPDLLPHPMARKGWQQEQERNLAYVAVTRAKATLYLAGAMGFTFDEAGPESGVPR